MPESPTVLIIRDGWGQNPNPEHGSFNAVSLARTPVAERLEANWPHTLVRTSGEDVGLPANTMGNSEVGHQNIGAGRIVDQELMRITRAIRDDQFNSRPALVAAFEHVRLTGGRLHLMGLLSDGRVHSDIDHLFALIDLAAIHELERDRLAIHLFTDGRDVGPNTGLGFLLRLEDKLASAGVGRIASICGRYDAMDRDLRWDRIARAYATLTGRGSGNDEVASHRSPVEVLEHHYANPAGPSRMGDEFVPPTRIVNDDDTPVALIEPCDAVIFFNFRGDRPRQICKAFVLDDEAWAAVPNGGFNRGEMIEDLAFYGLTEYEHGLPLTDVVFTKPDRMDGILGACISEAGLRQFRCAETEKFAHVTFFFNDYREEPFPGETRRMIQSPRDVATYDRKPEMSAAGICEAVLERLDASDCEDLIVVNFANPDMVGHTGKLDAAVAAVEVVDELVGRIVDATLARNGHAIVTADHGNAEQMWNPDTDAPHTAHTIFDVPTIVIGDRARGATLREDGRLSDLAPTVLDLMGLDQPEAMTGRSLLANEPPQSK